jgi:hypothetical protein
MEDTKIDFQNVLDLLNLAESDPDDPVASQGSPRLLRSAATDAVIKTFTTAKAYLRGLSVDTTKKDKKDNVTEQKSVATTINCVVKVLTDLYETVTAQGKQLKEIFDELKSEKTNRESLLEEIQRRYNEMEKRTNIDREGIDTIIKEQTDKVGKALEKKFDDEMERRTNEDKENIDIYMKEKTEKVEKAVEQKLKDLEIRCDEGRQREMKGTIIVSSPQRGQMETEATIRHVGWDDNTFGPEAEIDMVLRMVHDKTNVWIPHRDVAACHQFGKEENHSFVLKIWNRKRFSAWDILAKGMLTGKGFSDHNIFINFMLTPRRSEISKQVRQAKKAKLIAKYSVDQNGKFFVKQLGDDTKFYPVLSIEDLEKFTKKS